MNTLKQSFGTRISIVLLATAAILIGSDGFITRAAKGRVSQPAVTKKAMSVASKAMPRPQDKFIQENGKGGEDASPSTELVQFQGSLLSSPTLPSQPSVDPGPAGHVDEVEPNNTSGTAQALTLTNGAAKVKGNIQFNRVPAGGNDLDFYSFSATMGDRVYAATQTAFGAVDNSAGQSGDTVIEIFNTDGTTILEADDEDGTFNANSSSIAGLTLPATGTFFIKVRHFSAAPTTQILPYDLYLRLQSGSPTPEVEPNNNAGPPNTPTPLPANGWASGAIDPAPNPPGPDSDVFSLALNAGDTVFLSLDANPERDAVFWNPRLAFGVFDNFLILVNDGNAGSAPNPNSEAFFFTVRDAGTYLVYVDAATGGGPTFTYNLSVSVHPQASRICTTYTSTDVLLPKAIGPGAAITTSTLTIPDNVKIGNLKVNLNITFNPLAAAALGELDVSLIAPDGNEVVLFDDPSTAAAGTTAPQIDFTLDDEAAIPVTSIAGINKIMIYQPEGNARLYWFKNQNAAGTWTLRIFDDTANTNGGTLNGWGLTVCVDTPIPTCAAPETTIYSSDFEADDGMFTHTGTNDEWERGLPAFAPITTAHSGTNAWKTDLDNTYNPAPTSTTNVFQELISPTLDLTLLTGQRITFEWAMKYQVEGAHWDHIYVEVREVGGSGLIRRVFEHSRPTMTRSVGSPAITINQAAGWGVWQAVISEFAGKMVQLVFHLDNDNSVQLAGLAIDDVKVTTCSGPTEARLSSFGATAYNGGQFIEWNTGFEVDNLGFNLYRDQGGKLTLVNPSLIAGSALVAGSNTALTAGRSYGWWDSSASSAKTQYRLEAVDLKGQRTWYGPVSVRVVGGYAPAMSQADLLSRVGYTQSGITSPVSRSADIGRGNQNTATIQANLAGLAAVKISANQEGWHRVGQPELVAAGLNPGVNPRLIQLFVDGVEQPIKVNGEQDGRFDSGDSVEFYAIGLDTPSSDTRVYWLVGGSSNGKRIGSAPAGKSSTPSGTSFAYTVERKDRTIYFSSLRNGEKENFFGPVVSSTDVDQSLDVRQIAPGSAGQAVVEVALQGVTINPHQVGVSLNGAELGNVTFDGQATGVASFTVSQSLLIEGNNQVRLAAAGGNSDVSLINYIRITYQHTYAAESNNLRFVAGGRQMVTITGFTNSQIRVVDVTDSNAVQEVAGSVKPLGGRYAMTVVVPGSGQRQLLAFTDNQAKQPVSVAANQPSKWAQPSNGADLIVIARREYFNSLKPLVGLRQSQGLAVAVVDVEDIYDEFSYGQKTPYAIRDFLSYAKTNWKRKPGYVLLGGDASFDARNYLGYGDFDAVSSKLIDTNYLETFSDDWLVDFDEDGLANLAVGRLPFRTVGEAATIVAKIVAYEGASTAASVLLVSDSPDGYDFAAVSAELRGLVPSSLRVEEVDRGALGDAEARSRLLDAINRGQKVVNYAGHGSVTLLRGGLLTSADAAGLTNERSLPLFVTMTCLNGYFADPVLDSLAEAMVKADRRGAIAVWASTGLTGPAGQAVMDREVFRQLFDPSNRGQKLGDVTVKAKTTVNDGDVRRTWILFGDPTMRLR